MLKHVNSFKECMCFSGMAGIVFKSQIMSRTLKLKLKGIQLLFIFFNDACLSFSDMPTYLSRRSLVIMKRSQEGKPELDQDICTKSAVHLRSLETAGRSLSNTLDVFQSMWFCACHRTLYDRVSTAQVFEKAKNGLGLVKPKKVE